MIGKERHLEKVGKLIAEVRRAFVRKQPIQTIRESTHSTRSTLPSTERQPIDLRSLNEVIEFDKANNFIWVESGVTMRDLLDSTLKYGMVPPILPEFPKISVGGAVSGPALESGSFRYGQFNDICSGFEVITGDGSYHSMDSKETITMDSGGGVTTTPHGANGVDLWHGIPGSMGTLGIITGVKVGLVKATKFVQLSYYSYSSIEAVIDHFQQASKNNDIHYIEGLVFSEDQAVVIEGRRSNEVCGRLVTFTEATDRWYWRHVKSKYRKDHAAAVNSPQLIETTPIIDYLFRYDRGAFWMGEFVRKKLRLRDDILSRWIMDPITDTGSLYAFMHQRKTADTYLIQDIYTPIEKTARFVQNVLNEYRISPLWLAPIKPAPCKQKNSPHYFPEHQALLVDVGIWGRPHGEKWSAEKGRHRFNQLVSEACGVHMAYATQDLTQDEFGEIYDLGWNEQLRERFHAQDLFLDLYSKIGSDKQTEADRREGTKRFLNSWDPKGLNGWFLKKIIGSMIQ